MSASIVLYLPHETRVGDVATVLGALSGERAEKVKLDRCGSYAARCCGVTVVHWATSCGGEFDGDTLPWVTFHHASSDPLGNACLRISGNAAETDTEMLLERLAAFFGGLLSYNDCEDDEVRGNTAVWRRPRPSNAPEDGAAWRAFQDELLAVEPLPLLSEAKS